MNDNGLTVADVAALQNGNVGQGSWIWFLLIFVLLGFGGGYGGGRGSAPGNYVTQSQMTAGLNNQTTQAQLSQLALATQQNNYETVQAINGQTNALMSQNNSNLINAIQGFNSVSQQLMSQTNTLGSKMDQLSFQLDKCCCDMKSLIQNNRIEDLQQQLTATQNILSNANQTQNILGTMGRWVGWSGTGTQTAGVVSAS